MSAISSQSPAVSTNPVPKQDPPAGKASVNSKPNGTSAQPPADDVAADTVEPRSADKPNTTVKPQGSFSAQKLLQQVASEQLKSTEALHKQGQERFKTFWGSFNQAGLGLMSNVLRAPEVLETVNDAVVQQFRKYGSKVFPKSFMESMAKPRDWLQTPSGMLAHGFTVPGTEIKQLGFSDVATRLDDVSQDLGQNSESFVLANKKAAELDAAVTKFIDTNDTSGLQELDTSHVLGAVGAALPSYASILLTRGSPKFIALLSATETRADLESVKEKTGTEVSAEENVAATALLVGVDTILERAGLRPLTKGVGPAVLQKAGSMLGAAVVEGSTEVMQQFFHNDLKKLYDPTQHLYEGAGASFIGGTAMGGGAKVVASATDLNLPAGLSIKDVSTGPQAVAGNTISEVMQNMGVQVDAADLSDLVSQGVGTVDGLFKAEAEVGKLLDQVYNNDQIPGDMGLAEFEDLVTSTYVRNGGAIGHADIAGAIQEAGLPGATETLDQAIANNSALASASADAQAAFRKHATGLLADNSAGQANAEVADAAKSAEALLATSWRGRSNPEVVNMVLNNAASPEVVKATFNNEQVIALAQDANQTSEQRLATLDQVLTQTSNATAAGATDVDAAVQSTAEAVTTGMSAVQTLIAAGNDAAAVQQAFNEGPAALANMIRGSVALQSESIPESTRTALLGMLNNADRMDRTQTVDTHVNKRWIELASVPGVVELLSDADMVNNLASTIEVAADRSKNGQVMGENLMLASRIANSIRAHEGQGEGTVTWKAIDGRLYKAVGAKKALIKEAALLAHSQPTVQQLRQVVDEIYPNTLLPTSFVENIPNRSPEGATETIRERKQNP